MFKVLSPGELVIPSGDGFWVLELDNCRNCQGIVTLHWGNWLQPNAYLFFFCKVIELYNHYCDPVLECFLHTSNSLEPIWSQVLLPPLVPDHLWSAVFLYKFICVGHFIKMESYNMYSSVSGFFFNLHNIFEVHPFYRIYKYFPFLLLSSIPLHGYHILFIHSPIGGYYQ